jgi:hypothetical protein
MRRAGWSAMRASGQAPAHSAHVGQEVEVHYRWHALHGRRVLRQYVERRAGGDVVHVEVAPGNALAQAAALTSLRQRNWLPTSGAG